MRLLITIIFLSGMLHASAQEKMEREFKIKQEQAPAIAKKYIDEVFKGKVKWYQEYNENGMYYEAKFRKNKKRFSVKFDSTGILYDVEELFKFKSTDFSGKSSIETFLENKFQRWKVTKAQYQWIGDPAVLRKYLLEEIAPVSISPNFELVVRGKNKGDIGYFEFIFNESGQLISEKRYADDNLNNLIF